MHFLMLLYFCKVFMVYIFKKNSLNYGKCDYWPYCSVTPSFH